ncbi:hypothetical protein NFI96_023957 [Prochilodus magdalenae]|nr:hypothetical protein NFI96_023957 [Prochilodus magdalenae]
MTLPVMMEKKQRTMKQTAAKIKTKIHNTSSFFKLSLKTNNKALALALVAQKQRTRQLETETVCLQKDVQALRFELAIQRHKNKQMFTVLREFYNNSINCMAKAVDLISKEEVIHHFSFSICNASQSEKDVNELLPEQGNTTNPSKCVEQEHVHTTDVNVSAMNDHLLRHCSAKSMDKLPSLDQDHATPQNTLYDSEMEMTVVDSVAEIVTVQTIPRKNCEYDQGKSGKSNESCLLRNRKSIMSSEGETLVKSTLSNHISVVPPMEASSEAESNMDSCAFTSSNKEENSQEQVEALYEVTGSVSARRKTHVTSRTTNKNKRMHSSQKHTEGNPEARKTYIVSPYSSNCVSSSNDLDDYFSDLEAPHKEKGSVQSSCDDILPNDKSTESEDEAQVEKDPQKGGTKQRKTFVISHKTKPQKSRKTRVPSLSVNQNTSHETESTHTVDSDACVMETSVPGEKHKSRTSAQTVSQAKEPCTVKNRGTYVIHASKLSVCSDILNDAINIQEHASYGEMSNTRTLEDENSQYTPSVFIGKPQKERVVSPVLTNKSLAKVSSDKNLPENSSELSVGQPKPGNRTDVNIKVRKKNVASREKINAVGKKKGQNRSAIQNVDTLATELPGPAGSCTEKENDSSSTELQQSTVSQCSIPVGCFMDAPRRKTGNANHIHSVIPDSCDDIGTIDDHGIGLRDLSSGPQNIGGYRSKCRETFVVSSNCNLLKGKEKSMVNGFNRNPEDILHTDRENEMSLVTDDRTFIPLHNNDNQSTPRKTDQLRQTQSELFSEDRLLWEPPEFGSAESFICDNPPTTQSLSPEISSQTVDIYEEPGWNMMHQPPDERVMKNLSNSDLTSNESGRTRRKAAPMSYKEPSLNCKMRRGDKFSDTKFLSSPLFKDKGKKRIKKNKV